MNSLLLVKAIRSLELEDAVFLVEEIRNEKSTVINSVDHPEEEKESKVKWVAAKINENILAKERHILIIADEENNVLKSWQGFDQEFEVFAGQKYCLIPLDD